MNGLEQRFAALWARLGLMGGSAPAFADLAGRYGEPHRAYHTLAHLEHCLRELDGARDLAADFDAVELALWFHDAVYDTHAADSEERSARLMAEAVGRAGGSAALRDKVAALILATRHAAEPEDADARLLVDVDLAILGQPEDAFDLYEHQVRREYGWVLEPVFRAGRAALLKGFLARRAIYATDQFRTMYEAQARANLARSLARLA
jgi:predicted metal-dependent HD superfamily phosphohydrolase